MNEMTKTAETEMKKPITLTYDFKVGSEWIRKTYIAKTYEDWHRIVRILHENKDHYKVVKVER